MIPASRCSSGKRAFTLIELVIAMSLGLVILLFLVKGFQYASSAMRHAYRLSVENGVLRSGFSLALEEADFWTQYDWPDAAKAINPEDDLTEPTTRGLGLRESQARDRDYLLGMKTRPPSITKAEAIKSRALFSGNRHGMIFTPFKDMQGLEEFIGTPSPLKQVFDGHQPASMSKDGRAELAAAGVDADAELQRGWNKHISWNAADSRTWYRGCPGQQGDSDLRWGFFGIVSHPRTSTTLGQGTNLWVGSFGLPLHRSSDSHNLSDRDVAQAAVATREIAAFPAALDLVDPLKIDGYLDPDGTLIAYDTDKSKDDPSNRYPLAPFAAEPLTPLHSWRENQLLGLRNSLGYYGMLDYLPANAVLATHGATMTDKQPSLASQLTHSEERVSGSWVFGTWNDPSGSSDTFWFNGVLPRKHAQTARGMNACAVPVTPRSMYMQMGIWDSTSGYVATDLDQAPLCQLIEAGGPMREWYNGGVGGSTAAHGGRGGIAVAQLRAASNLYKPMLTQKPENWPDVYIGQRRYLVSGRFVCIASVRWASPEGSLGEISFSTFGTSLRGARQQRHRDGGWADFRGVDYQNGIITDRAGNDPTLDDL